ncbi:MAG: chalcone isomerase family protein, partial [bacterium]
MLLVSPLAANAASLIGASLYKDLGKDLFVVGLYSDGTDAASITSGEVESRMELKLISPLSKRRWANLCLQSIAINNSRESLEASAEDLVQIFGNIKGHLITEDSFTVNYAPGQGSTVSLNGITLLQTKGVEILNLFLSIWLGPVPPSTDFKAQILGQQSSGDAAARLSLYAPSQQRVATIKGWVDAEEEVKPEPEPEPEPQVAAVEEPAEEPTEEPAAEEPAEPVP